MIGKWFLPEPAGLIGRAAIRLARDRVQVLHEPRDAAGLAAALEQHLLQAGYSVLPFVSPGRSGFRAELAERLAEQDGLSAASLAGHPSLRGAAVLVQACGPLDADVQAFARHVRRQDDEMAPCLAVITGDGEGKIDGVAVEEVRNAAGPLDGAAYAAWLPRSENRLVGELMASVAIEVAAWDVELLDRLMALPPAQAVRPDLGVPLWDDGRAQAWKGTALLWENGCLDAWGGEDAEHPAWLAANKPARLTKRVWKGQLAHLLPWIELHRLQIIERCKRGLQPPANAFGTVELLDWGPLVFQLRKLDDRLSRTADPFRTARNELAHGRPVTWPQIKACLTSSAGLLGTSQGTGR